MPRNTYALNNNTKISENSLLFLNESSTVSRAFYTCSLMTKKLIVMGLFKLVPKLKAENLNLKNFENQNEFVVNFSKSEFLEQMGITKAGTTFKEIEIALESAVRQVVKFNESNILNFIPWFSFASIDRASGNIVMKFNPPVMQLALDIQGRYSNIELSKVGKLKSFYAIRYYEICKSFYNTKGRFSNSKDEWKTFEMSFDYLRELFQLKNGLYEGRNNNFIKYVIKNPIDELNAIGLDFTVSIELVRKGRGGKVQGVILHCKDITNLIKIDKNDSTQIKLEKVEANKDRVKLQVAKQMKEWEEVSKNVIEFSESTNTFLPPKGTLLFDIAVYTEMQKRGLLK